MSKKGFSANVLNMKFMKQAELKQEEIQEEEVKKKLKDLSEWTTDAAAKIKSRSRSQVIQVGYTNLQSLNSDIVPIVGKRKFGNVRKEIEQDHAASEDLDKLWKEEQKSDDSLGSKRLNSENVGKNKPTKKRK